MCPNVWFTFEKIIKIKFDGVRGRIRKSRLRYYLIIFIYSEGPLQHYIKFSENFTVIFNFNSRFNSIFGQNSQISLWEIIFFSVQWFSVQNLKRTKAVKVFKTGMNILTWRVWAGKILHNIRLKIQCRGSAIPKAWELIKPKNGIFRTFQCRHIDGSGLNKRAMLVIQFFGPIPLYKA